MTNLKPKVDVHTHAKRFGGGCPHLGAGELSTKVFVLRCLLLESCTPAYSIRFFTHAVWMFPGFCVMYWKDAVSFGCRSENVLKSQFKEEEKCSFMDSAWSSSLLKHQAFLAHP